MGIFSSYRHPLNEAEVDDGTNKPTTQDDEDYTAGADTAADDESNDPAPDDAGGDDDIDYTDGADEAGDDETNDEGTSEEGQDDQGDSEGDDVDYTDGVDDASDGESDDTGDESDPDSEGSDGDVDYTDGADDSGDDESGDADDTGEEGEDNTYEDLRKIEAELFSNLSPEQIDIKNKELKQRFIDIYGTISSVILRINDIPKTDTNVEILHFVTDKLMELKDLVDFTVQKSFDTKTYIENSINYQICLSTLNTISDIIASAQMAEENPTTEEEEDQDGVIVGGADDSEVNPGDDVVAYGDKMIESADAGRFNTFF